jgi:hypothetical protein
MQPEERDLIAGLFGRLKQFEGQARDPEAEGLIASAVASQPSAPYYLVQTLLVQEQALKAAQGRIAELEAKVAAAPPPSFLGSAPKAGPWGSAPGYAPGSAPMAPPMQAPAAAPGVFQAAPSAGGGFLRQAMTTAAGVAGGALLFEGIRNMMGHNPGPFGASPAAAMDTSSLMPSDLKQNDVAQNDPSQNDSSQNDTPVDNYDTTSDDSDTDDSDLGGFDSDTTDDI